MRERKREREHDWKQEEWTVQKNNLKVESP